MNVEIINIGDELLIGQIINTNCSYMSKILNDNGVDVKYITVIGDKENEIEDSIKLALQRADCILITGGLGPTKDDVTKNCLNKMVGGKLIENKEVSEHVKSFFVKRGLPYTETNHSQAFVPERCQVIFNPIGTAPGMLFNIDNKLVFSMPGVPFEMERMMKSVVPIILSHYKPIAIIHKNIIVSGIGESFLSDMLEGFEKDVNKYNQDNKTNHFSLAYLPKAGIITLRLSARGQDREELQQQMNVFLTQLKQTIQEYVVGEDNDNIATIIGKILTKREQTLSTAESCTGGNVAHLITINSGASQYFKGSVVSYCNEIKNKVLSVNQDTLNTYGAVSEQTVIQMAKGAISVFNTDYAVSTTGIAGPNTDQTKTDVGTLFVCAMDNKGHYLTNTCQYTTSRENFIDRATNNVLFLLLELIKKER
ncbi:MAG: CinA family nicotinamide mononucleotide deamidase-related protein [Bacteroidales bacterium]|jgi:nicotinamide-nucleotide amidase|nr:CinA family nicotinamide mononucleotide deamidase-related protein [Bacteroidales bacterium]